MPTPRWRILCIDDDEFSHELLCIHLAGYEIVTEATLTAGRQRAEQESFDLYLLDVMLPDGNGIELCKQLRQSEALTPIIFLTADARPATREAALRAGAQMLLSKPVDFDALKAAVTRLIG